MAMLMSKPFGIEEPIWMSDRGYREEEPPYIMDTISYRNYPEPLSFTRYPEPPTTFGRFREPPTMYPHGPAAYGMFPEPPHHLGLPRHHPDDRLPKGDRFRELVEQPRSQQIRRRQPLKVHPEIELRVPMSSSSSEEKIRNELKRTEGVTEVKCDRASQKVTVTGKVDPEALLKRAKKVQKKAEFWSGTIYSKNFIDFIQSKTAPPPKEPEVDVFSTFRHQSSPGMRVDSHDPYYDTQRSATFSDLERDSAAYDDASFHYNSEQGSFSSPPSYGVQQPRPSFYFGRNAYDCSDERERVEASYSSQYTPVEYGEMDSHLQSVFPSRPSSYRHHHGEEFSEGRDYSPAAYESNQLSTSYQHYDPSSYETYYDSPAYQERERSSVYGNHSSSDWELENYYPHKAYFSSHPAIIGDSGITNSNYMQHVKTDY